METTVEIAATVEVASTVIEAEIAPTMVEVSVEIASPTAVEITTEAAAITRLSRASTDQNQNQSK